MTYIDIHTHNYTPSADVISIENIYRNFSAIPENRPVSIGLHPWYLQDADDQLNQLKDIAQYKNIIAIGECGLDKLAVAAWTLQVRMFEAQLQLATDLNKTVIIHSVKSITEILQILKGIPVPVIFHGINNKLSIISPAIDSGYFLSFGKSLVHPAAYIRHTFNAVPLNQLFLETDDSGAAIKDIYKSAAEIRNIPENEIALQLQKNYYSAFNYAGS